MEKLRSQLAATEIEKRKEEMIPDLSLEQIERFLKRECGTVWMKDMSEVLKNYVAAVPNPCRPTDVGGRQGQQLSLSDALAYRVWKVLNVAHSAYVKRYCVALQEHSIQAQRWHGLLVIEGWRLDSRRCVAE